MSDTLSLFDRVRKVEFWLLQHTETTISDDKRAEWPEAFELVPSPHAWHASNSRASPERSSANWSRTPSANHLRQGPNGTYADALYWSSMSPAGSSGRATAGKAGPAKTPQSGRPHLKVIMGRQDEEKIRPSGPKAGGPSAAPDLEPHAAWLADLQSFQHDASGCRTDRAPLPWRTARREVCGCDRPALADAQRGTAKLSRLTAGPSRAVPKATCRTGNCAACWPARSGEALLGAARLVQRLAVDRADAGFENLHSAPAHEIACGPQNSVQPPRSHSRNAV